MIIEERIKLLLDSDNNYTEIRLKTSDEFMEMMKFMFNEKYKLIECKENEYKNAIYTLNNLQI